MHSSFVDNVVVAPSTEGEESAISCAYSTLAT